MPIDWSKISLAKHVEDPEVCEGCGSRYDAPPGEHPIFGGTCDSTHVPQHQLTPEQLEQKAQWDADYSK